MIIGTRIMITEELTRFSRNPAEMKRYVIDRLKAKLIADFVPLLDIEDITHRYEPPGARCDGCEEYEVAFHHLTLDEYEEIKDILVLMKIRAENEGDGYYLMMIKSIVNVLVGNKRKNKQHEETISKLLDQGSEPIDRQSNYTGPGRIGPKGRIDQGQ